MIKRRVKKIIKRFKKSTPAKRIKKNVQKRRKRKIKKSKKRISTTTLIRSEENPIISPRAENGWEAWQTFNPGVILLDSKVHFLYRAIGKDGISRLGYAVSSDGFHINERLPYPVYEHQLKQCCFNVFSYFSGGSWGGCEDPRLVRVNGEEAIYMTYTACDQGLRIALTSIKVKDFLKKRWRWKAAKLISPPGEIHKNWVIFPEKINGKYAVLHSINPKISITYLDNLEFNDSSYINSYYENELRKGCWDSWIRGVGPPPIKTKDGWLVFYHAMDNDFSKYKIGAMLLDFQDPTKILHRSKEPILEPEEFYENNGFKAGIVYASGSVIKDGNILLYYGGADNCICVAYSNLEEFLKSLKKEAKPRLKLKTIKKK